MRFSPAHLNFGLASNFCPQGTLAGLDGLKGTADDVLVHVNGLICVLPRGRPLGSIEVLLDQADGLEWETAVRCDLIHLLARDHFHLKPPVQTTKSHGTTRKPSRSTLREDHLFGDDRVQRNPLSSV